MARRYHTHVREVKAVEYTLKVEGLEAYKSAWLSINNNAREYPDTILKVWNSYGNEIYILCPADSEADTKSWLEQFGEVIKVDNDKVAVMVDASCQYTDSFDSDYVDSEYVFGEID